MDNSSFAGYQHSEDDAVHDYERKAPLSMNDIHKMFRVQPKDPVIAKDYRPEDTLKLMDALKERTTCIIPTCDVKVTLDYMKLVNYEIQLIISHAEDEGWSRLAANQKEGKLARELLLDYK